MATIQLKRKTSTGSGPLTGSTGTVKQGEPLVDLNGGNLYIAKADKTASSSAPLAASDYLEYLSKANTESLISAKISALGLGTASKKNTGTTSGTVPVIGSDGKLDSSIMPAIAITNTFVVSSQAAMLALSNAQEGDIAVRTDVNKSFILKANGYSTLSNWQELLTPTDKVQSVNGKTGTVTITLSELGGVSTSTYNSHVSSNLHLTNAQRNILENAFNADLARDLAGIKELDNAQRVEEYSIENGLLLTSTWDADNYEPPQKNFYLGINKDVVMTYDSTIDGGTY